MPEALSGRPLEPTAHRRTPRLWSWLSIAGLVVLAALIYRPWRPIPLPVSDWGGFLTILTGERTIGGRFHGLLDTYVSEHGRYQPALMATLALTWSAVGENTIAWQWIRFSVMTGMIIACVALAVRLGATWVAATVAGVLLVISGMAQQSWILLQLPEPGGTLALVCAALLAAGYGSSERWPARAAAIVLLLVLAILHKETFIVAVPFVLALALWAREGGRWVVRPPQQRDIVLLAAAVLAIGVVNVAPVLNVRRLAEAQAYGARYDLGSVSAGKLRNVLSALFLPVTRVWWFPANVAFLAAVISGVILGVRRHGRSALMAVGVLLSLSLAGVATYLPWFAMEGYYALAFLPGLLGLFALALTWLWQSQAKTAKALAVVTCGLLVVFGTLLSSNYINVYRASRAVEERAARALEGLEGRTLIVGIPSPTSGGGFAAALREYAQALGVSNVPPGIDVPCADAFGLVTQRPPAVVVMFSALCGNDGAPSVPPALVIRQSYVMRDWKTFARSRHDVSARIWAGATPARGITGG